tara:strand:- start:13394 stop:13582 length:189 start_codon:yes stop_codon:yes gene_type:complete
MEVVRVKREKINDGQKIFDWIQRRIDYWEDAIEEAGEDSDDYDKGLLQAFYEVQEFITGERQ